MELLLIITYIKVIELTAELPYAAQYPAQKLCKKKKVAIIISILFKIL